jgi:hypothetical protein
VLDPTEEQNENDGVNRIDTIEAKSTENLLSARAFEGNADYMELSKENTEILETDSNKVPKNIESMNDDEIRDNFNVDKRNAYEDQTDKIDDHEEQDVNNYRDNEKFTEEHKVEEQLMEDNVKEQIVKEHKAEEHIITNHEHEGKSSENLTPQSFAAGMQRPGIIKVDILEGEPHKQESWNGSLTKIILEPNQENCFNENSNTIDLIHNVSEKLDELLIQNNKIEEVPVKPIKQENSRKPSSIKHVQIVTTVEVIDDNGISTAQIKTEPKKCPFEPEAEKQENEDKSESFLSSSNLFNTLMILGSATTLVIGYILFRRFK